MQKNGSNPWKGAVLGVVGSMAGLIAMDYYWQQIAPLLTDSGNTQSGQGGNQSKSEPLDSISLIGQHYKAGETSIAALGRILYQAVTGKELESEETKMLLSYLVHGGYGMVQGGVYGATRSEADFPDLKGGLAFATGLWLLGDELVLPLKRYDG